MPLITPMNVTGPASPQAQPQPTSAVDTTQVSPDQVVNQDAAPVAEEKPAAPLISPQMAEMARRQKQMRQQQLKMQEERKALEADRQLIEQAKQWKQRIAEDPYSVMLESGMTADQVAARMLQQPNPEDQKYSLLQQELKAIKEAQEHQKQEAIRIQQQQYEDAVGQVRSDVEKLVQADDSYETIRTMGATEAVVALIEETFNAEKRLMSIDEAAKEVEDYLAEEAYKIAQIKKVRARFNPAPEQQVPQKQLTDSRQSLQQQPQQLKTLSNQALQSSSRPLTSKERRERAILAFQGKLN